MAKQILKGLLTKSIKDVDELVSNDFGKLLVSYYLVKKGLHVIIAKSEGFDMLVNDRKGLIFEKDKPVGINVKTRQKNSPCLDMDIPIVKLKNAASIWKFLPYFCFVTPHEVLIFPMEFAQDKRIKTKTALVSFARLRQLRDKRIIYFSWAIKERVSGKRGSWLFEI